MQPYGSSASNSRGQIKLSVRFADETAENDSALWVKNLGSRATSFVLGTGSGSAQELSAYSESIAGGALVPLNSSYLEAVRKSNRLLLRSDEQVAAIIAPSNLPIEQSEFYYYQQQQKDIEPTSSLAPRWVLDLGAVGKSGVNVFEADTAGYAPAIITKSDSGKRYLFGVGIALRRENSSVEIKLISKEGHVIKSLEVAGPAKLHWRTDLGEFISGADDFPERIEMSVINGKAQSFLSIRDLETEESKVLAIAPTGKRGKGLRVMAGGPYGGGYASFTAFYSCPFSPYSYEVTDAHPNTCGTLKLVRNGVFESTPGWICTDSNGYAQKGHGQYQRLRLFKVFALNGLMGAVHSAAICILMTTQRQLYGRIKMEELVFQYQTHSAE